MKLCYINRSGSRFFESQCSFLSYNMIWNYSDGDPLMGASNARVCKNRDFRPISRFISEMIQDRAVVAIKGEQETVRKLSNGTISNY